jgi:murein DD-endopeptidase MepM/ murein hydrolase activator NlpD
MIFPVNGSVISPFGVARGGGARSHEGIDIAASVGSQIVAAAAGRVFKAGQISSNAGLGVELDHGGGLITKYFHASRVLVGVGQQVGAGQVIAQVGQTGNAQGTTPHLHYEVWANGRAVDPLTMQQQSSGGSASLASVGLPSNQGLLVALLFIVLISRL